MTTTLVTGGAGFIGSHLTDYLLARGERVLVIDDLTAGNLENLAGHADDPHLEIITDSILNPAALQPLIEQADRVFHLAATVGVKRIIDDPIRTIDNNVAGTAAVLQTCSERQCPVFLASTSEVYGKSENLPFNEEADVIYGPTSCSRWSYACSKAMGEFLGKAYFKDNQLPVVIARLFNTAGARQTGQYGMVIPRFVDQALCGKPITVYGDGSQSRCFCHVDDAVSAITKLLESSSVYGQVINVGGLETITIQELAELIKKMTASSSEIVHIPFDEAYESNFEDISARKPDLFKARAMINFTPLKGLQDILTDVIEYRRRYCTT